MLPEPEPPPPPVPSIRFSPASPSKRKRDSACLHPSPLLDMAPSVALAGSESPRTVVADQLSHLRIKHAPPSPLSLSMDTDAMADMNIEERVEPASKRLKVHIEVSCAGENASAPGAGPYPSTQPAQSRTDDHSELGMTTTTIRPGPPAVSKKNAKPRSAASRSRSPSPHPSAFTWQDDEITGHLFDPLLNPDDDGRGVNGLGFQPTPTIAYARAQKRREQLRQWKAREAKEARQRRGERRRHGILSSTNPAVDIAHRRRVVRFVE